MQGRYGHVRRGGVNPERVRPHPREALTARKGQLQTRVSGAPTTHLAQQAAATADVEHVPAVEHLGCAHAHARARARVCAVVVQRRLCLTRISHLCTGTAGTPENNHPASGGRPRKVEPAAITDAAGALLFIHYRRKLGLLKKGKWAER